MKTDARIINSKKFLKEALLSLLCEMKLSDIKVVTLCERAEINRATFYSHYKNVYQLFEEIIDGYMEKMCSFVVKINENIPKEQKVELFKKLIAYVDKNSSLFVMIFENSSNFEFSGNQYQTLQEKIHQRIHSNNMIYKYITNYYIYSGGAILYTWIKNGKKESYDELCKILYSFINKGASYFISN